MTLEEKLEVLEEQYPNVYKIICNNAPDLVQHPSSEPSERDIEEYNFWVDSLIEDEHDYLLHYLF